MKLSNSDAKTFNTCRRQFYYKNGMRLQRRGKVQALHRGTWMHGLLDKYFKDEDWEPLHEEYCEEYVLFDDEQKLELGDLPSQCEHLMKSYEYVYAEEDEDLELIGSEVELETELPHGHVYQATIDKITRDELGLWVWDHKTHAKYPSANYRFTDIQTARYSFAVKKHYGEWPVGIVWDYIITKKRPRPQLLKDGTLSKRKIITDLFTFLDALDEYGLDPRDYRDDIIRLKRHNEFLRRDKVPVTKTIVDQLIKELIYTADDIERGFKPVRTIGRHCDWCEFQMLCMTELYGGDAQMVIDAQYEPKESRYSGDNEEEDEA